MRLSNKIVNEVLANRELRLKLALKLGCTEQAIRNNANRNEEHNKLTTLASFSLIKEITGLTEAEIFEQKDIATQ